MGEPDDGGCQPLGGEGRGELSVRRGGTAGNGVTTGTVTLKWDVSRDDGICESIGGS